MKVIMAVGCGCCAEKRPCQRFMISGPEGNGLKINSPMILCEHHQATKEARVAMNPCRASLSSTQLEMSATAMSHNRSDQPGRRDGHCHRVTQQRQLKVKSLEHKKQAQSRSTQPWGSTQPIVRATVGGAARQVRSAAQINETGSTHLERDDHAISTSRCLQELGLKLALGLGHAVLAQSPSACIHIYICTGRVSSIDSLTLPTAYKTLIC